MVCVATQAVHTLAGSQGAMAAAEGGHGGLSEGPEGRHTPDAEKAQVLTRPVLLKCALHDTSQAKGMVCCLIKKCCLLLW